VASASTRYGALRSNVAAADYQPSFPLHTAAKSQVPRMLILHTKRQLRMVHGDLKGQAPSAAKLQTVIQILHAHSYYWYRISCRPRLSLNVISKLRLSMRQSKDGARREYITQRKGLQFDKRRRTTKRDTPQSLLKKTHHHIRLSLGQMSMSYLHQAHLHLHPKVIINLPTMHQQTHRILYNIQRTRRINSKSIYIQK